MTYGQVAGEAGNARGARQVARILHSMCRAYQLPWHRIINAKGEIALKDMEAGQTQKELLEREGIVIGLNGKVDLERFRYDGS
nr:MGMT family protein [Planomicrobium sp. YIM 101495]